jgi:maleylpyruvate isomerase
VSTARDGLLDQIDGGTSRLLQTAGLLTDEAVRQPSLLPGWTRGHVLNHLVHSAGAMVNLLNSARTGVNIPAYASQQARDAEIAAGAGRSAAQLLSDLTQSAAAFWSAVAAMPQDAWQVWVQVLDYPSFPAAQLLTRRLVEVELHHTDLAAGYTPADWPAPFARMDLPEPMRTQRASRRQPGPRP